MCGIVGLFLKTPELEPQIGRLTAEMLAVMTDRGPDSTGFAVYSQPRPGSLKLTLRGGDFASLPARLAARTGVEVTLDVRDDHALLTVPASAEGDIRAGLAVVSPETLIVGAGTRMELYKGVGLPAAVSARFGLPGMSGTHAIGHTRMATESAVTTAGAHPFSTGLDQCLVHNGSLSNHNNIRRALAREGQLFETANDSEVAAGYLSWRMRRGEPLDQALQAALSDLDGFYTFVVGTEAGFGVLRDAVACKPAVMAETEDYVAFGSEYRALTKLPGIAQARIFEPEPQRVYFWERAA
jgi:methylamine---glutamate N-methyltransferase subunit A